MLSETVGHYAAVNVQRQHDPEHRAVSVALAQGKSGKALEAYANHGAVLAHANRGLVVAKVAEA